MASNSSSTWNQFVQDNLLSSGLFDGVYLISSYGELIYCYGPTITENECKQFVGIFDIISEKQELKVYQNGCSLNRKDGKVHYKVYKKSFCSMYCLCDNQASGLVACNLPYGMLITTYGYPVQPKHAVDVTEKTCSLLRS